MQPEAWETECGMTKTATVCRTETRTVVLPSLELLASERIFTGKMDNTSEPASRMPTEATHLTTFLRAPITFHFYRFRISTLCLLTLVRSIGGLPSGGRARTIQTMQTLRSTATLTRTVTPASLRLGQGPIPPSTQAWLSLQVREGECGWTFCPMAFGWARRRCRQCRSTSSPREMIGSVQLSATRMGSIHSEIWTLGGIT